MMIRSVSGWGLIGVLLCSIGPGLRAEVTAGDDVLRSRLVGTWRIVSMKANGQAIDMPQESVTYKHVTPAGFTWLSTRKGSDRVYRAAGGTYTLHGATYTEKIEYGMGDDYEVIRKTTVSFTCKIEGDKWYHQGKLANGTTLDEVWERVRPAGG